MLVGQHMRTGVGNNSHTTYLIQSDTTNGSTVFADTGRGGIDHSANIATEGNPAHSTAQKKFGATSINLPAAADCLTNPLHADWDFAVLREWTVDLWARLTDVTTGNRTIALSVGHPGAKYDNQWTFWASADVFKVGINRATAGRVAVAGAIGLFANTWYHLVIQRRQEGTIQSYVDGVPDGRFLNVPILPDLVAQNNGLRIGSCVPASSFSMVGFLDEFRITKGSTVYPWGGFTPPNRMH